MKSIDEAIAQELNIAKNRRKNFDECNERKNNYACRLCVETQTCLDCAEEHEQLAEWLEELKQLRENANGYNKEDIELNRKAMYNKAIYDFAEKLNAKCDAMIKEKWNSNVAPISWAEAYSDFKDDIDEIAEQLKAGGDNE